MHISPLSNDTRPDPKFLVYFPNGVGLLTDLGLMTVFALIREYNEPLTLRKVDSSLCGMRGEKHLTK